ncbi:hypothetical protein [Salinarimonas soli]|uniref:hypothetical protein n=1 Tax=Salinarimonas soli TaxID=1638099 RepID=UPI0016621480|nr:hypothetical protein [Salinarimonas soli]
MLVTAVLTTQTWSRAHGHDRLLAEVAFEAVPRHGARPKSRIEVADVVRGA